MNLFFFTLKPTEPIETYFTCFRLWLIFFFLLRAFYGFAQTDHIVDPTLMMQAITPTSPNVTALGRHTMQPPNLSNGLPQQSIPLFEIKENGLDYSLSLFYNYSGFRLNEHAPSAGLGWGLTEGVIMRIVKHIPDEIGGNMGKYEDFEDFEPEFGVGEWEKGAGVCWDHFENAQYNLTYNRLFYKLYDAQPDLYIYNFNGYSGKFLWINGKAVNLEHNDIIIERGQYPYNNDFTLTTPDGVTYLFQEAEKAWSNPPQTVKAEECYYHYGPGETYREVPYITTWRIKTVKNHATNATMNFTYKNYTSSQAYKPGHRNSYTLKAPYNNDGNFWIQSYSHHFAYITYIKDNFMLDEIISDNYKVKFIGKSRLDGHSLNDESALDEIRLYDIHNQTNPIKVIKFGHDYFGATNSGKTCWLKLKNLRITGGGNDSFYEFSYVRESFSPLNNMAKDGLSIDHWGYFNNKLNHTLTPFTAQIEQLLNGPYVTHDFKRSFDWANREPDFNHAQTFALETVKYPTKGTTKITYESANGRGIRVASLEDFDGKNSTYRYYDYHSSNDEAAVYPMSTVFYYHCCLGVDIRNDYNAYYYLYSFSDQPEGSLNFIGETGNFYGFVTEYIGQEGKGGRIDYRFSPSTGYASKVLLKEKTQFVYGKEEFVDKEEYHYGATPLKQINYWDIPKMTETGYTAVVYTGFAFPGKFCCPRDPAPEGNYMLGNFDGGTFFVYANWIRMDSIVHERNGVRKVKAFDYLPIVPAAGLPKHTQPVKITETQSDGAAVTTNYYYPGDVDPDDNSQMLGVSRMWDRSLPNYIHYINPVIKTKRFNEQVLVHKEAREFSNLNELVLMTGHELFPDGSEQGKVSWSLDYDDKGNVVEAVKDNNIITSFFWGYNSSLPLVKAENVDYITLSTAISLSTSNLPQLLTDIGDMTTATQRNLWKSFNDNLKSNLPQNVVISTYTYIPLVGITSLTDTNGNSTYFEYDTFDRLELVKDNSGNIVNKYDYNYKE